MKNKKYCLAEMHLFQTEDAYFVFKPIDMQLYQLDQETYEQLNKLKQNFSDEFIDDVADEELIDAGLIVESDSFVDDPIRLAFEKSSKDENDDSISPITNVVLQIANDCNLNCIYCYGDGGSYGRVRELMTYETAKKAIDFTVANSEGVDELLVTFFGGEPLMNFDVVKKTFAYCKSIDKECKKSFSFNMTTNGTILNDEIFNFIKDNDISVMISMDGGEDIQNKHRCFCDGRGSFDIVKKNIERFKEARGGYLTARATVCSTDIMFKKIKDDLLGLGFTKAVTSIVDTDESSPLFVGGDNTEKILEQYRILADDYVNNIMSGKTPDEIMFTNTLCSLYFKKIKVRSCNAGNNGIAVGTDGNIYPCHRFMGMSEHIIGSLANGIDPSLQRIYREATVFNKEECKECWARYMCSGGCAHTSAVHGGDVFHAPSCYCDIFRGVYEIICGVYWKLKEWDDDVFRKMMHDEECKHRNRAIAPEYAGE